MARATRERRTPRRRLSILAASGLVAVLATIATVAYAATPGVVLDEPGVQENTSSASDGYLVWSAKSKASPNRSHSYVMAGAGSPVRIDPPGGQSYSAAIDGTTIVYQEWGNDDLGFFDAVTEVRTDPPAGVNTRNSECRPSLSGDWLLFTRSNSNRRVAARRVEIGRAVQRLHLCAHRAPEEDSAPLDLSRERSGEWRLGHVRIV